MTGHAVHANCLVLGTCGLLIEGGSGSGKSELADLLIEAARTRGNLGVLVADDRAFLSVENAQLVARAPESILGLMEVRGAGVMRTGILPAARIGLTVELAPIETMERFPESFIGRKTLEGIPVPALICPANRPHASLRLVRWGLRALFPASPDYI